jgi:hypothetical protein
MKRLLFLLLSLSTLLPLAACARSASLVDVQVVDLDDGNNLPRLPFQGRTYLEGQPGHRFSVSVQNLTGERVLAVVSVDGVNAISGQTAGASQAGYVLEPWQRAEIRGWRKSYSDVAEFYFTDLPDSYAARTGRPQNVGVIGVAAFRERQRPPVPYPVAPQISERESSYRDRAADASGVAAASPSASRADSRYDSRGELARAKQELGTGHGERRYDPVSQTSFEREAARPNQVVSLFYDSYASLAQQGIVPRYDRRQSEHPDAFPIGFAADPWR